MRVDDKLRMKDFLLNYRFRNEQLMTLALTHRSASQNHNERLEYLGDAVLGLIIAEDLFKRCLGAGSVAWHCTYEAGSRYSILCLFCCPCIQL